MYNYTKLDDELNEWKIDFEQRLETSYIDSDGMLHVGWNISHYSCPFAQSIIKKSAKLQKQLTDLGINPIISNE